MKDEAKQIASAAMRLQKATVDILADVSDPRIINGAMSCLMARTIQSTTMDTESALQMAFENIGLVSKILTKKA